MLSNLAVRSNLLAFETYQRDIRACSAVEFRDIQNRSPNLMTEMTAKQHAEVASRRRGGIIPTLSQNWTDPILDVLNPETLTKGELSEEEAFEFLAVARRSQTFCEPGARLDRAVEIDRAARAQLARSEFRLSPEAIEARLAGILGSEFAPPPLTPTPTPIVVAEVTPTPVAPPPVTAVVRAEKKNANWAARSTLKTLTKSLNPEVTKPIKAAVKPRPVKAASPRKLTTRPAPERVAEVVQASPPEPAPVAPEVAAVVAVIDHDLARVNERWVGLPPHVRQCILMLIDAAPIAPGAEPCPSTPPSSRATLTPASAVT